MAKTAASSPSPDSPTGGERARKRAAWGGIGAGAAVMVIAGALAFGTPALAGPSAVAGTPVSAAAVGQAAVQQATAPKDAAARCDRLKKQQEKRRARLTRLQAGADTRGSVAWLTAKAKTATAAGDPALAKLYTDRAALRSKVVEPLQTVAGDLDAVIKTACG